MQQYLRVGLIAPEIRKTCCAGSREFSFRVQLPAAVPADLFIVCTSSFSGPDLRPPRNQLLRQ